MVGIGSLFSATRVLQAAIPPQEKADDRDQRTQYEQPADAPIDGQNTP